MNNLVTEYLTLSPRKLASRIRNVVKAIRASKIQFDAIAYRGNSGALIAPGVAIALNKPLILVRKNNENSHSSYSVEGYVRPECSYIIVDDFVSSGATIEAITVDITQEVPDTLCVGVFLYEKGGYRDFSLEYKMPDRYYCSPSGYIFVPAGGYYNSKINTKRY